MEPVTVFYSYSHEDRALQQQLMRALSPLVEKGLIREWFDGHITPGEEWDTGIQENLQQADVVLILISADFVASEYCRKEMGIALGMLEEGAAMVIPINLRAVNWEGPAAGKLQELPSGRRPVTSWEDRDAAWADVSRGIEKAILKLASPGPIRSLLGDVRRGLYPPAEEAPPRARKGTPAIRSFESVAAFWNHRASLLDLTDIAVVRGTFSQFAPMTIGAPIAKRRLHREFRRAMEQIPEFARFKLPTLNACMSISAGQMVWRLRKSDSKLLCFGLYDSIVRNSIPVYVTREYYDAEMKPLFASVERQTFEAQVRGRVTAKDNTYIRDFFDRHNFQRYLSPLLLKDLCTSVYALVVDGEGTRIEALGPPRYLDGDIWVAVETDGEERFVSTFLDVANPKERDEELHQLMRDILDLPGKTQVIAQYDDVSAFLSRGYDLYTGNPLIGKSLEFVLGMPDGD